MSEQNHIRQLAKILGKPDSSAVNKILAALMTQEEAGFLLDLPGSPAELAKKYGLDEAALEKKVQNLASRGLVIQFEDYFRFPRDLITLHDSTLSSAPELIPPEMHELWMDLYENENWVGEIGNLFGLLPSAPLRVIPVLDSTSPNAKLRRFERIEDIIEAHKDLITVRDCCCRNGAERCGHPRDVCMQFGSRAKLDLYRGSGKKVSAEEALAIARRAGDSGLVPTVPNVASVDILEFICFCCGCCCMILDPAGRAGTTRKIVAPSRLLVEVQYDKCTGCEKCPSRCAFDAIEMTELAGFDTPKAVINAENCVGCGACVPGCPEEGAMSMIVVRPPEFIPQAEDAPSVLHMQ